MVTWYTSFFSLKFSPTYSGGFPHNNFPLLSNFLCETLTLQFLCFMLHYTKKSEQLHSWTFFLFFLRKFNGFVCLSIPYHASVRERDNHTVQEERELLYSSWEDNISATSFPPLLSISFIRIYIMTTHFFRKVSQLVQREICQKSWKDTNSFLLLDLPWPRRVCNTIHLSASIFRTCNIT